MMSQADEIRKHLMERYVRDFRNSDEDTLSIRAGDVVRDMSLHGRTPNVCSVLGGQKFLTLAGLEIVDRIGPAQSTTTTYFYRRDVSSYDPPPAPPENPLPGGREPDPESSATASKMRVEHGLVALREGLEPYVTKHMRNHPDDGLWQSANRAEHGRRRNDSLDVQALLNTMIRYWDVFQRDGLTREERTLVNLCRDARNKSAHFSGEMKGRVAERYLDAMREVLAAIGAAEHEHKVKEIYEEQRAANERQGGTE